MTQACFRTYGTGALEFQSCKAWLGEERFSFEDNMTRAWLGGVVSGWNLFPNHVEDVLVKVRGEGGGDAGGFITLVFKRCETDPQRTLGEAAQYVLIELMTALPAGGVINRP